MSETQTANAQQPQQQVKLGFEKALVMHNPNWRTEMTETQINAFRHFYHQGFQDVNFLIQLQTQQMNSNLNNVMNTILVTGNEEKIAAAQAAQAEAAQAAEAGEPAPAEKQVAKAKKATPKAPVKATPKASAKPAKKGKR